ncbi:MAG: cell division protein ZipA [Pseudomonadota bacterium]|nr:cell division protein ZipA [Pseudomonadota bacterium]
MTLQPVLALAWNPAVGVPMFIAGVIVLALIWLFGQPKKEPGARRAAPGAGSGERREPTVGGETSLADDPVFNTLDRSGSGRQVFDLEGGQGELDVGLREELERLGATLSGEQGGAKPRPAGLAGHAASIVDALRAPAAGTPAPRAAAPAAPPAVAAPAAAPVPADRTERLPPRTELGRRPAQLPVERIISLFVVAREGSHFNGPDLIVAAEKAGLEFGDMGIYHRLVDGKRDLGPIFSVANMLKPGSFDLARLDALRTPGVSFFMTLPAPVPALDAWDAMLPTAQRLAELLDGQVLDEERNALGRQRVAHIRDQLRGWDRDHEGPAIIFGR